MNAERFKTREEIVSQLQIRHTVLTSDNELIRLEELTPQDCKEVLNRNRLVFGEEKAENEKRLSTKLTEKMREMGWLDYEKASGKGHFKFYPKGAIVHSILENVISRFAQQELEANPVITPIIFNWSDEQVTGEAGTFYNDLYHVQSGADSEADQQILRFGCDIGVFKLMQNTELREEQLPVRIYEGGTIFRACKSGEKSNIQRADSYYLPSIYSFCKNDPTESLKEISFMHKHFSSFLKKLGLEYSLKFEINESFFNQYRDQIVSILKYDDKPALVNLVSNKRHYFELKSDHVVDNVFKSFNIQLDDENATTYDIKYTRKVEENEEKEPCTIIHSSLTSVERWMLILMNDSMKKNSQELPLWLSPVQLRIITLDEKYNDFVMNFAKNLSANNIRVDVDDRKGKINNKVRKASNDLVPYTILWGRNEQQTGVVNLRKRDGNLFPCVLDSLSEHIKSQVSSSHIDVSISTPPATKLSKTPSF